MSVQKSSPDFVAIKKKFDKALTNGQRADIRRIGSIEDLSAIRATYTLLPTSEKPTDQWLRVIYFLPYAKHAQNGDSLGVQLAKAGIRDARLFQVVRSESPQDLIYLRRLLTHVEPVLDWQKFGELLYYWGTGKKRRLAEDFFLGPQATKPTGTSAHSEQATNLEVVNE